MYQMPNRLTDETAEDDVERSTEAILGALFDSEAAVVGKRLHIATKANPWAEWDESLDAVNVRRQLETSLAALGKDCVDLFYLHAPDSNTPIRETLQTVDGANTHLLLYALTFDQHSGTTHPWRLCGSQPCTRRASYWSLV